MVESSPALPAPGWPVNMTRPRGTPETVCRPFNRAYGTGSAAIAHPPLKWRAIFGVEALRQKPSHKYQDGKSRDFANPQDTRI